MWIFYRFVPILVLVSSANILETGFKFLKDLTVDASDVSFSLFTPTYRKLHARKMHTHDLGNNATFKIIIHGWTQSPAMDYIKDMTSAYFKRGNYNVVHVNWSVPASVNYVNAIANVPDVGVIVAKFILRICGMSSTTLKDIHILGHSLGAHVAGTAGREIYRRTGRKIRRITGLDPARPLFENMMVKMVKGLSRDDARMVDIVHTDAGGFGYLKASGTVDFYPNGGSRVQPGCPEPKMEMDIAHFHFGMKDEFCSHWRSHTYYITSINSDEYVGVKCHSLREFEHNGCKKDDKIPFGEDAPFRASGKYYFKTEKNIS